MSIRNEVLVQGLPPEPTLADRSIVRASHEPMEPGDEIDTWGGFRVSGTWSETLDLLTVAQVVQSLAAELVQTARNKPPSSVTGLPRPINTEELGYTFIDSPSEAHWQLAKGLP